MISSQGKSELTTTYFKHTLFGKTSCLSIDLLSEGTYVQLKNLSTEVWYTQQPLQFATRVELEVQLTKLIPFPDQGKFKTTSPNFACFCVCVVVCIYF